MSVGPASDYFKTGAIQEGNKDFAGELSATLVDTQKLLLMSFLVELGSLQDIAATDSIINLQGGWGLFRKRPTGEVLLCLTYKAYVEDEEDDRTQAEALDIDLSDDESSDSDEANGTYEQNERDLSEEKENLLWIYDSTSNFACK